MVVIVVWLSLGVVINIRSSESRRNSFGVVMNIKSNDRSGSDSSSNSGGGGIVVVVVAVSSL